MARHAILSDVHANWEALSAVYKDFAALEDLRDVWSLGDLVGYGPNPNEVIGGLNGLAQKGYRVHYCLGNHDGAAIGRYDFIDLRETADLQRVAQEAGLKGLPEIARHYKNQETRKYIPVRYNAKASMQWTIEHLTEASRKFLAAHSKEHHLLAEGVLCIHGSPRDPYFEYITDGRRAQKCLDSPLMDGIFLCFLGHSHIPGTWQWKGDDVVRMFGRTMVMGPPRVVKDTSLTADPDESITIINVGAVGQPRDGDPRAAYAVFDDQTNEVELRRVEYDVETTRKKILASGLPEALAQRIGVADAKGGVISEEDVQPADAEEA
jgi:diadenosine tetraphosphatase ApaH/serine/threonine PP2A family protein phosphatase